MIINNHIFKTMSTSYDSFKFFFKKIINLKDKLSTEQKRGKVIWFKKDGTF